jgi:hypothetical protein
LIFYFTIFGVLALYAGSKNWVTGHTGIVPLLIGLFLTVFVGYRYEVGVDWPTYMLIFSDISRMSLLEAITYGDPAYSIINWAVSRAGGQIWHVNLICAAFFFYGLIRFCSVLPRPGLALAVLVPMLVISTAMGYTRQATAVGFVMLAFVDFRGTANWRWIAWLAVAVLFHRSAIFAFPLFAATGSNGAILRIVVGGAIAVTLLLTVVMTNIGDVLSLYLEGDMESSGAIFRTTIGALVGFLYFILGNGKIFDERQAVIRNMAIAMIALLPMYALIPSSTIIDRIGILLLPFQGAILSSFAYQFREKPGIEIFVSSIILVIYAAILAVWLFFSSYASYWINYENVYFVQWL